MISLVALYARISDASSDYPQVPCLHEAILQRLLKNAHELLVFGIEPKQLMSAGLIIGTDLVDANRYWGFSAGGTNGMFFCALQVFEGIYLILHD